MLVRAADAPHLGISLLGDVVSLVHQDGKPGFATMRAAGITPHDFSAW